MVWWTPIISCIFFCTNSQQVLHSTKMAISNWANPSPSPTPSSLSLSCQVMWPKNQHHRAKVVLFVGARCESLQQTAQLSADMHYTKISMNIMTKWWISWHLYKDIHEYHDTMMNIMTFIQRYPWISWQNDDHDHNWLIDKGVALKSSAEPRVRNVTKIQRQRQSAIIFEELSRRSFTELYFSRSICGKGGNLPTASNKSNSCSSKISTLHSPIPSHNPQFQFSQSGNLFKDGGRRI